ncbi:PREDICTED: uncharacterized protein LOC109206956 [Nicotiana attenuata]|uniref:uncharacterized protein LOC109206956 n=1 Tax=Nicotiana attenuata TaxID=49451 RepID=UPI000904A0D0|nr:PREDICTED: uncharacterized protein LOC109206956 [Nicotiana attenuata]
MDFLTKCKGLQLNHLCFADDILLFCKGELQAIVLMLRGLQSFSNASVLTTNAAKSDIFIANMDEQCLQDLCELTGYKRGSLPFRYLGVPISSKKLVALDCEILVDKMTMKIKCWGTRNLSYAGRVLLVNAVLMHIHSYWASIFVLPKKVIKSIIGVCMSFLSDGKVHTNKSSLAAWDLVCRTKRHGGLGVHDTAAWNEAVIAKYVWNIAAKTDNMWVRWNHWLTTNGVYTLNNGYSWKKGAMEDRPWRGWVWNKMNMPKHNLICWLVAHNRLLTKDRLKHMGISKDSLCEICGAAEETVAHLFFECPLARRCMEDTLR